MAWNWGNFAQGGAGGAATGFMLGGPVGAAIGLGLGGVAGGLTGQDEQEIPDFNAAERSRDYLRRFGGFGERLGAVGASSDTFARRTAADLISAGVDPVSAQNIASRRAAEMREQNVGDLISSTGQMEAQLAGQMLPYEIEREEDQISLRNLQANEPGVFESFIPTILSAAYTGGQQGAGGIRDWLTRGNSTFANDAAFASTMGNRLGGVQTYDPTRNYLGADTSGPWSFLGGSR